MSGVRSHLAGVAPIVVLVAMAPLAWVTAQGGGTAPAPEPAPPEARCDAELHSWVVAGRGRHMALLIDCPPGLNALDGAVEFTTAAQRLDYDPAADLSPAPRVARMSRGERLRSPFTRNDPWPDERLEARWSLTPEQAACLQRDRLFSARYILLGTNSNSGMAGALLDCDLALPERVAAGAGLLGEFPGVDLDPGDEIPLERWESFGVTPQDGAMRRFHLGR